MKDNTLSIGEKFIAVSIGIIGFFVCTAIISILVDHSLLPFFNVIGNAIGKVELEWLHDSLVVVSLLAIFFIFFGIAVFSLCTTTWIFVSISETFKKILDFKEEERVKPSENIETSH